jgi:hypothetical protein
LPLLYSKYEKPGSETKENADLSAFSKEVTEKEKPNPGQKRRNLISKRKTQCR